MALSSVREMYINAAIDENGSSRVEASVIREAVTKALAEGDLSLRAFKTGSVGTQVRLRIPVRNDEGDEFVLTGQVMLTVPETVAKKA